MFRPMRERQVSATLAFTFDGRPIQVRLRIHCPHADRCLFEQAFSADGGRHWETNWQAVDTRLADAASR